MRRTFLLIALSLFAAVALAESEAAAPLKDDIPLDAYLDTLGRIAPAARAGADTYLNAFQRRCGRPLTVIELRRAIADGAGEPVLMAMMRAASQHDTATLQRLSSSVSCVRRM
jgi:hypothetical protein